MAQHLGRLKIQANRADDMVRSAKKSAVRQYPCRLVREKWENNRCRVKLTFACWIASKSQSIATAHGRFTTQTKEGERESIRERQREQTNKWTDRSGAAWTACRRPHGERGGRPAAKATGIARRRHRGTLAHVAPVPRRRPAAPHAQPLGPGRPTNGVWPLGAMPVPSLRGARSRPAAPHAHAAARVSED